MRTRTRRQSLATSLRLMRGVIRRAEETDFTSRAEDRALNTVFAAVSALHNCLRELAENQHICDCAERSWYGAGHDSWCNVTWIRNVLEHAGHLDRLAYYVLFIDGDTDPQLYGPFSNEKERDNLARRLRREDRESPKSGIYRLTGNHFPRVDVYPGGFFEDETSSPTKSQQ